MLLAAALVTVATAAAAAAPATTPCAPAASGTASGQFTISAGHIIAPDGSVFIAKGINLYDGDMGNAAQVLADFPGINFIRLNAYSYQPPSYYAGFLAQMSGAGVVVEIEHHVGSGGGSTPLTGSNLSAENAWFSALATANKTNPDVWFGTLNEPAGTSAMVAEQASNYAAIRGAGNPSVILIELPGGGDPGTTGVSGGVMNPAVYASMTNIVWDQHFYGWADNYSTNQATVSGELSSLVASDQTITSADGVVPVLIGEYGISTVGMTPDPNAAEVIITVTSSGLGSAAWNWNSGGTSDNLTAGGQVTSYGQQVAAFIALIANAPASVWACSAAETQAAAQTTGALVSTAALAADQPTGAQPATTPAPPTTPDTTAEQAAQQQAASDAAMAAADAQAPANAAAVQQGTTAGLQADTLLQAAIAAMGDK